MVTSPASFLRSLPQLPSSLRRMEKELFLKAFYVCGTWSRARMQDIWSDEDFYWWGFAYRIWAWIGVGYTPECADWMH